MAQPKQIGFAQLDGNGRGPGNSRAKRAGCGGCAWCSADKYGKHCVSIACKHAGTAHDGGRIRQHHCARRQGWPDYAHPRSGPCRTGFQHLRTPQFAGQQAGRGSANFAAAGLERARNLATGARHDGAPEEIISGRRGLQNRLRPNGFRARIDSGCRAHVCRSADPGRDCSVGLPPNMEGVHHSSLGASCLAGRNVFDHALTRLLSEYPVAVRAGTGDRHRRGRRDRRC